MGTNRTTAPACVTGDSLAGQGWVVRWLYPGLSGLVTPLEGTAILLGRGQDCAVPLAGDEVSRHHAEIVRDGPIFVLRDLGSRNGTFLDGARIEQGPLGPGSVVRLGDAVGVVAAWEDSDECAAIATELVGGVALARAIEPARRVAESDLPIVVTGETGTGKECVARSVHGWSGRAGPFHAVNCAAIPESLAESELFGFRKGAFTGADRTNPGHLRLASGGTLLLDEVTELSMGVQAKLLRALERREVQALGDSRTVSIDVRVVCTAQDALGRVVDEGRLRPDLYARLAGVTVALPPLRERKVDVVALFRHFLRRHSGGAIPALEGRLVESLLLYDWPFNVRELETLARRMIAEHGHDGALRRAHLPSHLSQVQRGRRNPEPEVAAQPEQLSPEEREERLVVRFLDALRAKGGNVSRAAASVGISRQRAYRLMSAREEIRLADFRKEDGVAE